MNNERQFEHIEDKIRTAAENNTIVFVESSWIRMEALLNKKEPKRRFLWFWFFVPLAFAFAYISYSTISKNKIDDTKLTDKKIFKTVDGTNNNSNNNPPFAKVDTKPNNDEKQIVKKHAEIFLNNNKINKSIVQKFTNKNMTSVNIDETTHNNDEIIKTVNLKSNTKTKIRTGIIAEDIINSENILESIDSTNKVIAFEKTITLDSTKTISKKDLIQKNKPKKEKKLLARLYIVGGLGADAGNTKLLAVNRKEIESKYGLSLGFNINKRISIQTGFYKTNKKYTGGPNDYIAKEGTYLSTIKINKVEATCLIYEVPIDVRYNFLMKKSFDLFAKIGVSSYTMKSEDYKISYVRNNYLYARQYAYSGNDHLFSNANISFGFEKNISKKLALQIEPCISLPLKGVGEGSIKLYSTAILFNLKYTPFKN